MRIYIHTDLEGVSGIDTIDGIDRDRPNYHRSCELLMADINAAVAGAFDGGATHVAVLDSHGGGGNFLPELLDPRAWNDSEPKEHWWARLDNSYDATFFIGAHAMAGTRNAFLDHTQSSVTWHDYCVNGRHFGELAQWAMVAGAFGVPLTMVSGDRAACSEARHFFNPVETVAVKYGIGRNRAQLVKIDEAHQRIRETARRAMALVGTAQPLRIEPPIEITLRLNRSDYCDDMAERPGVTRTGARTIRKVTNDPLELLP